MNAGGERARRVAIELALIAVVVTGLTIGVLYAVASPGFDHPVQDRAESAWDGFVAASIILSVLGTSAAWVVWLTWRRRAELDAQPDGPARLLAVGVATLPSDRREWGVAMSSELASLTDRGPRWRFAAGGARAALTSTEWRRPAAGWAGGTIGLIGAMACVAAAIHLLAIDAGATAATPAYVAVVLVVALAACLATILAAPSALRSSPIARRTGMGLGIAGGISLLVWSRAGALESGALALIIPVQLLAFVVAPAAVAAVARSLRAGLQCILWGFVFSAVTMFPVYIIESIRRYGNDGGLYLDGDAPVGSTVASNLTDAVAWLVLVVPALLVPLGVVAAGLLAMITRTIAPPDRGRGAPRAT